MSSWEKRLVHCGEWVGKLKEIIAGHPAHDVDDNSAQSVEYLPKICTFLNQRQIVLNTSALSKISTRLELTRSIVDSEKNVNQLSSVVSLLSEKQSYLSRNCKYVDNPLPKCVTGDSFFFSLYQSVLYKFYHVYFVPLMFHFGIFYFI